MFCFFLLFILCRMKFNWTILTVLVIAMQVVNTQFAMPIYPPQLPQVVMSPFAVALPAAIEISLPESTTPSTTTTSTERNIAIAFPFPVPMPAQYAVPALSPPHFCLNKPRPRNCPPCPPCVCLPSCTPAFFSYCSQCHLKCRCRNQDAPEPQLPNPPQPMPGPAYAVPVPVPPPIPPVIVVPFPSPKPSRQFHPRSSETYEDSSSSYSYRKPGRKRRKPRRYKRIRHFRRNFGKDNIEVSDDKFVKPILTYVSKDGDVKLKARINSDEAAELLGEKGTNGQTVQIATGVNTDRKSQLVISTKDIEPLVMRNEHIRLGDGMSYRMLREGKKELVFRPPEDKRISNLSVSFKIA